MSTFYFRDGRTISCPHFIILTNNNADVSHYKTEADLIKYQPYEPHVILDNEGQIRHIEKCERTGKPILVGSGRLFTKEIFAFVNHGKKASK